MKKPNRIARKGDIARTPAQSKATRRHPEAVPSTQAPAVGAAGLLIDPMFAGLGSEIACFDDQRLFHKGSAYYLVTDYGEMHTDDAVGRPGQTVQTLTRAQVRDWLNATVIDELIPSAFRRDFRHRSGRGNATAQLTLGELLDDDAINGLNQLGADEMPVGAQVAGAVASWLSFAAQQGQFPEARQRLREAPGLLDGDQVAYTIQRERSQFLAPSTAAFYDSLLDRTKGLPFAEAVEFLGNLAALIEYHPGLAEEFKTLHELTDAECGLGRSAAVMTQLKP